MTGRAGGPMMAAFQPSDGVFSPGLPLAPANGPQPTRAIDFPVGWNTVTTPRGGGGDIHSFASLRAYANVEPVRLAIETVKDQVERLDWKIKATDGKKGAKASDSRLVELTKFFRKPDGVTPFASWLRESLEDLLVIDAPAFEKRRDRGGRLIGLDVVPGNTFKLLIDETGRRPRAPLPAYQQIIKGVVWNDLTTDDLIYAPRNPRPDHLYGFSPVEQIIVTINTVMRRQGVQLAYFTEGNVPAGILNTPAGWGADQIKSMQDAWDIRMEGNLPSKNKLQWVPFDTKYTAFKESPLKDEFDEWLYRIVCFAFSLPPTAFVKQMNRATAQQGSDSGKEEGIESRKLWWKRIADDIIQEEFGYADLEWGWSEDVEVDPVKQATIDDLNLKNGSATIDEVRDSRGLDVIEGGDQAMIYLPTGPVLVSKVVEDALNPPDPPPVMMLPHPGVAATDQAPPNEGEDPKQPPNGEGGTKNGHTSDVVPPTKVGKLAKAADVSIDRPIVRRATARAKRSAQAVLKAVGDDVAGQVEVNLRQFGKVAPADDGNIGATLAAQIAAALKLDSLDGLDLSDDLVSVGADSGEQALAQVGADTTDELVNRVNARAVNYAKRRSAELVSAQGPNNLVAPTRDMIRAVIADGLEQNLGASKIADAVQASAAFSPDRAELIAKTEIATANEQGKLCGWLEASSLGITIKKGWQTSNNGNCCDDCQGNEDQGLIELSDDFQSGDPCAPAHPRCECSTYPSVVDDNASADTDQED